MSIEFSTVRTWFKLGSTSPVNAPIDATSSSSASRSSDTFLNLSAEEFCIPAVFDDINPPQSLNGGVPIAIGVGSSFNKLIKAFAILITGSSAFASELNLLVVLVKLLITLSKVFLVFTISSNPCSVGHSFLNLSVIEKASDSTLASSSPCILPVCEATIADTCDCIPITLCTLF